MEEENKIEVAEEKKKRIGGVIISHGKLAGELLAATQTIVGDVSHMAAVSIDWNVDVDRAQKEIENAIAQVSDGKGVLLLTDMFGGTPTNIASMFLMDDNVEVVTGVNLPMVIRIATQPEDATLDALAHQVLQQGRDGIYLASDVLMPQKN
jgi:PTS system mannose-specific IIA component